MATKVDIALKLLRSMPSPVVVVQASSPADKAIEEYEKSNPTKWPPAYEGASQEDSKKAWQMQKKVMTPEEAWEIHDKSKKEYKPPVASSSAKPATGKKYTGVEVPKFYKLFGEINDSVRKWAEAYAKTPSGSRVKKTLHTVFDREK